MNEAKHKHGPLYFDLNTGAKIPMVALGTWKAPPGVVGEAVKTVVKAGYRRIDFVNEKEIGVTLKELFSNGVVKRSEMFITSKLCDHAPEDVSTLSKSLEDLQFDYIDLYLLLCFPETWNAMEGLYTPGQARAIGVNNFSTKKLQDLLGYAKVAPVINQVECHPVWQQPALHNFCKSNGVHLSAFPPLGSPGSWIKREILKEPTLIEIAEKLNKLPVKVALRWGIQTGHNILLKSGTKSRIIENLSLFHYCIPPGLFLKFSCKTFLSLGAILSMSHKSPKWPFKSVSELFCLHVRDVFDFMFGYSAQRYRPYIEF
ncbi:hypothetical protein K2173_019495 [Erythroxylum novogranatense]|uniref:NADP-dependent oxidoreductase domain-containing protein n=1 Tax=Erythroxylum novogranatense TaxID=1862640 RepID=A0AAV8UBJ9_9ROSI|nr:hypothetical protein K2173_019495 [Erythroxylum novogranatense]